MARSVPNPSCCTDPRSLCGNCQALAAGTVTNVSKAVRRARISSKQADAATEKAHAGNTEALHTTASDAHKEAAAAWSELDGEEAKLVRKFHSGMARLHENESMGDFPDDTDEDDDDDMEANSGEADLDQVANFHKRPRTVEDDDDLDRIAAKVGRASGRPVINWSLPSEDETEPVVRNVQPPRYYAGQPATSVNNGNRDVDLDRLVDGLRRASGRPVVNWDHECVENVANRHSDMDILPIDFNELSASNASDRFTVNRDRTRASYQPPAPPTSDEVTFDPINWQEWSDSNASDFAANNAGADSGSTDPLVSAFWD